MPNKTVSLDDINAMLGDDLASDELSELDKDLAAEAFVDANQDNENIEHFEPVINDEKPVDDLSDVYDDLDKSLKEVTGEPAKAEPTSSDNKAEPDAEPASSNDSTPIPRTRVRNTGKPVSTFITDETLIAIGQTRETVDELVDSLPVKAREKVKNLINFLQSGVELSVYTRISLNTLVDEGKANSGDFRCGMMESKPKCYPVNTASTQAGQMMATFPALKIAERKGNVLHINLDSPFIKAFLKIKDAA